MQTDPEALDAKLAVSETEAARRLDVSRRHLWGLRTSGKGPRHIRLGRRVLYRLAELDRWLAEREKGGGANE
jgi:predicted DNA-binding transcriptional regulator AlpA